MPPLPSSAQDYAEAIRSGDRTVLARAITLIESKSPQHASIAEEIMGHILPHSGNSIRIGITGIPGVGKSTFIDALGMQLCEQGKRVAVLAVDPTSELHHGSILGDKTRMENLSAHPNAFIRPSPSQGTLGGVAERTRETMFLCEAAGFDTMIVETVGVGQSETTVRSMVDFFLLLALAGAGDELQGIKKGIVELVDAILITKADGDNTHAAQRAQSEFASTLQYLQPATKGWTPVCLTCSAKTGAGLTETLELIEKFRQTTSASGTFGQRRQQQTLDWFRHLLNHRILQRFYNDPKVQQQLPEIEQHLTEGTLTATGAVEKLIGGVAKKE